MSLNKELLEELAANINNSIQALEHLDPMTRARELLSALRAAISSEDCAAESAAMYRRCRDRSDATKASITNALRDLRHLYEQMINDHVTSQGIATAAHGLLGPAIERLERAITVGPNEDRPR